MGQKFSEFVHTLIKMAKDLYTPEVIQETPFPGEPIIIDTQRQASAGGNYSPNTTKARPFRRKILANELLSTALNTRSRKILGQFQFTPSGALQIGDFKNGVSGDLRISPNGITGRDIAGLTTFALDGTTGDAAFKGTVYAGSFVSGERRGATVGPEAGVNGADFDNIQEAIDFVNGFGGGKVFVKPGVYTLNSDITLYSDVHLVGEDNRSSIVDFDNNSYQIKIVGIVVVIIALVGLVWFFTKGPAEQQVSSLDATDTVGDFYDGWLKAVKDPTSTPSQSDLAKSPILSKALRDNLKKTLKQSPAVLDPVLCQTVIPEEISTRTVYENTEKAQILVMSRDKKVTEQALVTLNRYNDGWYINDILCSPGEFAPEREFSFESEGFLLKASIPSPYNSKNWHLVFEENGQNGNVVPLFFDSESQCTSLDGSKSVCNPAQFTEATKVFVRGQMTERGVSVNRQEFVK